MTNYWIRLIISETTHRRSKLQYVRTQFMKQILAQILEKHPQNFHPVLSFDAGTDKLLRLDFTKNNKELSDIILDDTQKFTNYINEKLKLTETKYGIGGYDEYRE